MRRGGEGGFGREPGMGCLRRRGLVFALLTTHAVLLLASARWNFVTVDEVGHIPSGISHWTTGTFSAYRVNPPLARMLAALPVMLARPRLDFHRLSHDPHIRPEWDIGEDFITANWSSYLDLVFLARLSGIAWSVFGGWLVYVWGRELFGDAAGCLGLYLWCFEPTVMAFAPLDTPDIPATVAGLWATHAFWKYLRAPSWPAAWRTGLLLGIAQLMKFTLVIFYAIWPLLWFIDRAARRDHPVNGLSWFDRASQGVVIVLLSILVINLGYGFRDTGWFLGDPVFVSRTFTGEPSDTRAEGAEARSNRFRGRWLGDLAVPVPAAYVAGVDMQRRDFEIGLRSYLAGRWRHRGWWYYYLYALAVKVPVGTLLLVAWALVSALGRGSRPAHSADQCFLWLPAGIVLAFVSSQTGFNHHMRYVLPIFPFVFVSTGRLAYFLSRRTTTPAVLVFALAGTAGTSSLLVFPHSLSYFNEAAGGPEKGCQHLLDSNIDWGQDLLFLRDWLALHPEAQPLGLAYFNVVDPRIAGIEFHLPPPGPNGLFTGDASYSARFGPQPGYYAVSVNYVEGSMSFPPPSGSDPSRPITEHEFEYFRLFRPIARAGYSILIYHITPELANEARRRLGIPTLP